MGCHQCGLCCTTIPFTTDEVVTFLEREERYSIEDMTWIKQLIPNEDGQTHICPKFSEDVGCTDYDARPPVCSDYPFYNKPPNPERLMDRPYCGYWSETFVALPF